MKYLKTYENFDLRKPTEFVMCVKDFEKVFKKGEIYELRGLYGDSQRAIEQFKIHYLPMECVSVLVIKTIKGKEFMFKNEKSKYNNQYTMKCVGDFGEYFRFLTDEELKFYTDTKKYNL